MASNRINKGVGAAFVKGSLTHLNKIVRQRIKWGWALIAMAIFVSGCSFSKKKVDESSSSSTMDPAVYTILSNRCVSCHSGANAPNGFSFVTDAGKLIDSGTYVIPGNPDGSLIYKKVTGADSPRMPYQGPYLSTEDIEVIRNWIVRLAPPSVTLAFATTPSGTLGYTNDTTLSVQATFSDAMNDVAESTFAVTNGTVSSFVASDDKKVYTFTVTPAAQGEVSINVAEGAAKSTMGVANSAATQLSVVYDTVVPSISISSPLGATTTTYEIPITVTASEALRADPVLSDFNVGGGVIVETNVIQVDSTHWSFHVTPTSAPGTVTIDYGGALVLDAAGNTNVASTQLSVSYTGTNPIVSMLTTSDDASATGSFTMSATLSASSTDFTSSDIAITGGSISGFSGSGTSYTFTVTPTHTANVVLNVASGSFHDADGGPNTAMTSKTIKYPTVTLTYVKSSDQTTYAAASQAASDDAKNYIRIPIKATFSDNIDANSLNTGLSLSSSGFCKAVSSTIASATSTNVDFSVSRAPTSGTFANAPSGTCNVTVDIPAGATYWTNTEGNKFGNRAATQFSMPYTPVTFNSDIASLMTTRLSNGTVKNNNACVNCHRANYSSTATASGYLQSGATLCAAGKYSVNCNATAGLAMVNCSTHETGDISSACSTTAFTASGSTAVYGLGVGKVSTTADTTSGSNSITVTSATGIVSGMAVAGTGIQAGSLVQAISGTTVTLSKNASASGAGVSVNFTADAPIWRNFIQFDKTVDGVAGAQITYKSNLTATCSVATSGSTSQVTLTGNYSAPLGSIAANTTAFSSGSLVVGTGFNTTGTGSITSGSANVTLTGTPTIAINGMRVVGYGIPVNTYIWGSGTAYTLGNADNSASVNATVTESPVSFSFASYVVSVDDGTHFTIKPAAAGTACTTNVAVNVPIVDPGYPLKSALFLKILGPAHRTTGDVDTTTSLANLASVNWFDLSGTQRNALTYDGATTLVRTGAAYSIYPISSDGLTNGKYVSAYTAPNLSATISTATTGTATGLTFNFRPLSDQSGSYGNTDGFGTTGSILLGGSRMPYFANSTTTSSSFNPVQMTPSQQGYIYNWILDGAHNN